MSHVRRSWTVAAVAAPIIVAMLIPGATATHRDPAAAEFYDIQWNLHAIRANAAWDAQQFGSPDVTVAILDTGIDTENPDLEGLVDLGRSKSFLGKSKKCPPSEPGTPSGVQEDRDAIELDLPKITDFHSHGTAVSALVSSNAVHLAGVTQHTTLIGVKVHDRNRRNCLTVYLDAVKYAADNGADVIHMSFPLEFTRAQFPADFDAYRARIDETMDYAHGKGAILVAAAGNARQAVNIEPPQINVFRFCVAKHVVCVSATGPSNADDVSGTWDDPAEYTNFGSAIDVAGPGGTGTYPVHNVPVRLVCAQETLITSEQQAPSQCGSDPLLGWDSTGTSFGAAVTSGLLSLLVERMGRNQPDAVTEALFESAEDVDPTRPQFYGNGRIDVANALALDVP